MELMESVLCQVQSSIAIWLRWLRLDIGFDAWRFDFVKGCVAASCTCCAGEQMRRASSRARVSVCVFVCVWL